MASDKVRIHPNEVLFLAPQAHKDIYGAKANVRRATSYKAWQTSVEPNTAITIDPQAHARKRKLLNQAFTDKSAKHAAKFVVEHTERWIDLLADNKDAPSGDGWTSTRNMSDWNDWLVFDILGDLCFGRSFDVKEPKPNPIRKIPPFSHSARSNVLPGTSLHRITSAKLTFHSLDPPIPPS
ncbi:uncharacterized protein N0V89_006418 [Didymosphaeria variabile]|uniref:Cytochrome P450 n=1 Tax=Didymosphaeria variabile TaxID=1932322 RepID=A0A9W9CBE1_9PLEO|nr:uncharacterized protein N0V89_006418 [Didymosphaeria variabile]KAJ4354681.1 hypothetical protein N0V89_006418 [Didymosphaeria variabile]